MTLKLLNKVLNRMYTSTSSVSDLRFFINFLILAFSFGLFPLSFQAQDIHFSQYDAALLNLNPANAGNTECDFRLIGNNRNQWQSVTVPYRTFSMSFDTKINNFNFKRANLGAGILFNHDKAGDSELSTTQIGFIGAFHYSLTNDSSLIASAGLNGSFYQRSINYEKLRFGSQFNGYQYDANSPNGETFPENNLQYGDISLGATLKKKFNDSLMVQGGFAYYHLNKPRQSYYLDNLTKLDALMMIYVTAEIGLNKTIGILPGLYIMGQGKYREYNFGGLVKFTTKSINVKSVYFGGFYRVKDAGIFKFAFDYQNLRFGISYDINVSSLKVASGGRGGLELSLIYNFCKPKPIRFPDSKICPVYF
ncbi:MAG: hypothetical protein A2033_00940 [Bacteroidetes bacterium GWA2_31_9]|nr:MAG: hypothetical protein A2033_00940 [Bacteroidetes bacterium GWA2_31_9]